MLGQSPLQVYIGAVNTERAVPSCLAIPHWEAVLARTRGSESNRSPVSRLLQLYIIFFKQREMHIF